MKQQTLNNLLFDLQNALIEIPTDKETGTQELHVSTMFGNVQFDMVITCNYLVRRYKDEGARDE